MNARITVIGSLNMDLVTNAARIPTPGETVIGGDLLTIPGGKGANQAVAAARLGAAVTMVGRVGSDIFASQLMENLAKSNVNHSHVIETEGAASGVALIVVDEAGQNSIVVAPGANGRLTPADVEAAEAAIEASDVVLLQLEIPLEAVLRAAQLARKHGRKVILNPAPARPLPAELLSLVDVLTPNESETAILSGKETESERGLAEASSRLHQLGVGTVILTLGERGALVSSQGQSQHCPAFAVDRVVDTTAAGDAFNGGFATALAEGKSIEEAVRWGNAAGAISVTRMGAQTSLPVREEVKALLDLDQ